MDNQPPPPDRQNSYSTAPPWQPAAARNYWVILLITLLVLLLLFWPVIPFLFFAIVLAYLTIPVVRFLQNRLFGGKRRGAAIAITFVLTFVLFIVGILAFVPPIIEQTQAVATSLPGTLENLISTPIRIGGDADADPFVIRDWLTQQERGEQFVSQSRMTNGSASASPPM
ncbi:MAG: AI-2E family transporter, partial [Chloroflexota bacterium]